MFEPAQRHDICIKALSVGQARQPDNGRHIITAELCRPAEGSKSICPACLEYICLLAVPNSHRAVPYFASLVTAQVTTYFKFVTSTLGVHTSGPHRERERERENCTTSIQPAWLMRTDLCSCLGHLQNGCEAMADRNCQRIFFNPFRQLMEWACSHSCSKTQD